MSNSNNDELQTVLDSLDSSKNVDIATSKYIDELYRQLLEFKEKHGISLSNITRLCLYLMSYIETRKELKGKQKKELIMAVFQKYADMDEGHIYSPIVDMLPDMIDVIVSVNNKEIKLDTSPKSLFKSCFGVCHKHMLEEESPSKNQSKPVKSEPVKTEPVKTEPVKSEPDTNQTENSSSAVNDTNTPTPTSSTTSQPDPVST